jgi:hypothetical protein
MDKERFVMLRWDLGSVSALKELIKNIGQITAALWAAKCAEHVLHYFESEYPDVWPRKAIEAAFRWARGEATVGEARDAALSAHSAARDAEGEAASFAARAAGHAAAAAHVKAHAAGALNYAVKAAAAAAGKEGAQAAITKEREWQYERLKSLEETA